jgi:site-specific DNA-methyltransferase (adenine-specific)
MVNSVVTNEDCMALMARYPDKYFDLAVVDPPYGIDLPNMRMGIGKSKKASKAENRKWTKKNWDNKKPTKEYFKELFRVSKNQIIWGGNYFELGVCNKFIIWDKEIPEGLSFSDCEYAWTSFCGANRIFRHSTYIDKHEKFHPTQKPIALYDWIFQNYAKPADKILDTHLGSGSSRIAAHKNKLDFTACELDTEYFEAQERRFETYTSQLQLF